MGAINPDRASYFGSSDIAPILGISPWRTPLDVYLDKVVGRQPEDATKRQIFARGKRLEPYIIDMYAEDSGEVIVKRGERYTDEQYPFMASEIDAETASGRNVEAKSTHQFGAKMWGEEGTDAVPVYYNAQAMFALGITGVRTADFPVLIGIDDFRIYNIERDDDIIYSLKTAANEFWTQHIIPKVAPPPSTVADLDRLFGWHKDLVKQATPEIRDAVYELKKLKAKIKVMEADEEELSKRIKLYMGEDGILQFGATPLATFKSQNTKRFDITAFKEKHARIAEKFTTTSTSRVLRLK